MIWPYTTVTIVTPEILGEKLGETWWNQRVVMVYQSLSVYPQCHKWRSCADPICICQLTTSPSSPNAVWNNHCSSKKFVIHVIHCYSRFKCLPGKITRSCCSETAHRWGQSASAPFHRRIALWLLLPRHELAGSVHSVGLVLLTSPLKIVPQLADISSKTHIILVQIYPWYEAKTPTISRRSFSVLSSTSFLHARFWRRLVGAFFRGTPHFTGRPDSHQMSRRSRPGAGKSAHICRFLQASRCECRCCSDSVGDSRSKHPAWKQVTLGQLNTCTWPKDCLHQNDLNWITKKSGDHH